MVLDSETGAHERNRTFDLLLTKEVLYRLSYVSGLGVACRGKIIGRAAVERETGIEPAPSAWKAEVLPLNYSRELRGWWREVDSNHRRRKPADLQSAPVGRLGIPPVFQNRPGDPCEGRFVPE